MNDLIEIIKGRKSVRTFDGNTLSDVTGDLQKIDVGIALCHFVMGLENKGKKAEVKIQDPGVKIPSDAEYIVSVLETEG